VYQLIITVMSIALASSAVMIQTKYTNPLMPAQQAAQHTIEEGFRSLGTAWDAYRAENQTYGWTCDTHTTAQGTYESCRQVLSDPGFLPVAGWSTALVPRYGFMPRPPQGMNWSYGKNDTGWYFCAEGRASDPQLKGFSRAQNSFPINSFVMSDTCGVTVGLPRDQLDLNNLKVTYWIKMNDLVSDGFAVRLTRGEVNRPKHVAVNFYANTLPAPTPGFPSGDMPGTPVECELGNGNGNGNGYGNNKCSGTGNGNGNGNGNGHGNAGNGNGNGNGRGWGKWKKAIEPAETQLASRLSLRTEFVRHQI